MTAKRWISYAVVFCLMPWMTGCESLTREVSGGEITGYESLTGRLWDHGFGGEHHRAAPEPDLKLSQTADGKDVLVQYDEVLSKDMKTQRRAYLLFANEKTIAAGRKPQFITTAAAGKIQRAPLAISYATNLSTVGDLTLRAVLAEDEHHFTLASNGREIGSYWLPDYVQQSKWAQVILTPATVTGDTIICASVVGLIWAYGTAKSGGTVSVH